MKPMRSLPSAIAERSASGSGRSRRRLSNATSASIAARLATSPAAAPPTPSATAASRGLAYAASSLLARAGPTSVRTADSSARAVMARDASGWRSLGLGPHPLAEERLDDADVAAVAVDELLALERLDRLLRRRDGSQRVAAPVVLAERMAGFASERLKDELLVRRRTVPEQAEVRVLGAQDAGQGGVQPVRRGRPARGRLLPEEVAQLLRRVRVAAGDVHDGVDHGRVGLAVRRREALGDERAEQRGRDDAELELLGAAPEGLVGIVEDPLHHVAPAAEVEVRDVGLLLKDRAQKLRQVRIERDDLLELVEDEQRAPLALGGDLGDELEQAFERRVDVGGRMGGAEREAQRAGVRVDRHGRDDPQPAEDPRGEALRPGQRAGDVLVDGGRELLGELLLRRRAHEVDLRHEHLLAHEALLDAVDERRLAEPARGGDDDVLAVARIGQQLRDLGVAVGERLVAGEGAEAEGIGEGDGHGSVPEVT